VVVRSLLRKKFGVKPRGSTAVCTSLVKETTFYYRVQCNDVYSVFLDASKAFDRAKYSELFHCLLDQKLPAGLLDYYLAYIQVMLPMFYGMEFTLVRLQLKTKSSKGVY